MIPIQQPKNLDYSRMTFTPNLPSLASGMPMLDMAVGMALQSMNAAPVPGSGQSVYDAYLQRERSRSYLTMMQRSVSESLLAQKLGGINMNSTAGSLLTMFAGQPDGIMDSRLMRAFNGGNPVKAMMGLNANFTGQTLAMAFGGAGEASIDQVNSMFNSMRSGLFQSKRITSADYNRVLAQGSSDLRNRFNAVGTNIFDDLFDSSGSFDQARFKKNAESYAKKAKDTANEEIIKAYEEVFSTSKGLDDFKQKVGTSVLTRTDPRKTMGYQFDDLTKAFASAADLGLAYSSDRFAAGKDSVNSASMGATGRAFAENAGGLLRAVSDLTGSTTADSALGELNALLGNSQLNMTSGKEVTQVEELLRRFKGAARAAGISVEAVMEILNTTRQLTASSTSLRFEGGTASLEATLRSLNTGTALMASLGPDWVRRNGGPANVQASTSTAVAMNKTEAITKQYAGLIAQVSSSTVLSSAQKEDLYKQIVSASNDPSSMSPTGYSNLLSSLAGKMGMSSFALASGADTEIMQQVGFEFMANRDRLGSGLNMNPARSLSAREASLALTLAARGNKATIMENGVALTEDQRVDRFFRGIAVGESPNALLAKYRLTGQYTDRLFSGSDPRSQLFLQNVTEWSAEKYNPRFDAALRQQAGATSGYAKNSMAMARRLAHLNTPFLDNLAQELISGNFSEGMNSLSNVIISPGALQRTSEMLDSARNMRSEGTMESFRRLYMDLHGGAGSLTPEQIKKNLADIYLNDQGYTDKAISIRSTLTNSNFDNLTEISSQLTLNQIKNGAENYRGSAAEKAGISHKKLLQARKFLKDSNMEAAGIFSKFGDKQFNNIFSEFGHSLLMREVSNITAIDTVRDIEKTVDADFEKALSDLGTDQVGQSASANSANKEKANQILGLLKKLGLVSYGDQGEWTDINSQKALGLISSGRFLNGKSEEEINQMISSGTLDPALRNQLQDAKIGSVTAGGKFQINSAKFRKQQDKERYITELEGSSEILKTGVANIGAAKSAGDSALNSAEGKFEKSFKEFQSSLGNNANAIIHAINSLDSTLRKFTG